MTPTPEQRHALLTLAVQPSQVAWRSSSTSVSASTVDQEVAEQLVELGLAVEVWPAGERIRLTFLGAERVIDLVEALRC